jgi:zinc protease
LTEGAGDLSGAAFKKRYLSLDARLSAAGGRDVIFGAVELLSDRSVPGSEVLRMMVTAPRFDTDAIEQVRSRHVAELTQAASAPEKVALNRWYADAFAGHPYGRPVNGTPETLGAITAADLKAQHRALFGRDVLKAVIVGDIDKAAARNMLDAVFGGLPEKAQTAAIPKTEPRGAPEPVVVEMDRDLSAAVFGLPSIPTDDPDFPALQVLNHVIGSGDFNSRLMQEVRIKKGFAYAIRTSLLSDAFTSLILGDVTTKNENMGAALDLIREVLAATARDGSEPARVDAAKAYLTKSFMLDFDSNAKVASSLLTLWLRGKDPGYLESRNKGLAAVTIDDVKHVAGRLLKVEGLIVAIAGNPQLNK